MRTKSENLGTKIEEAKRRYDAAWERISFLSGIVGELSGKRIEQRTKHQNVQKLKRNLKEMTDSDESLQRMLEEYQTRVGELHARSDAEKRRYSELSSKLQQNRHQLGVKHSEHGAHVANKDNYEAQLQHREHTVKQTARKHNIRGYELDVDEGKVMEFMAKIGRLAETQQTALDRARRETTQLLAEAQKTLTQISDKKSALNQKKEGIRAAISEADHSIAAIMSDLNDINVDEGARAMLESSVKSTESSLQSAKDDFEEKGWDKQAQELSTTMRDLDDEKDKLDAELAQAANQAAETAKIEYLHKEIKNRAHSMETMVNAHGSTITQAVGTGWEPSSLENDFQTYVERIDRQLRESERQREGTTRELDQITYRLKTCKDELKTTRMDIKKKENELRGAIEAEPDTYPQELEDAEKHRDETLASFNSSQEGIRYWKRALAKAQDKRCCLMCSRDYGNSDMAAKQFQIFQNMIRNEMKKAEDASDPQNLENAEAEVKELKNYGSTYDTWMRLKNDVLPPLITEETHLKSRHESLVDTAEGQDEDVKKRADTKKEVELLAKNVQSISKSFTEMTSLQQQVTELSKKQKDAGISRGVNAVQEDLKRNSEHSRTVKASHAKIVVDREGARANINRLELDMKDVEAKLNIAIHQLQAKTDLEKQVNKLRTQNADRRSSQQSTENEIRGLGPHLEEAQMKYDDIARRGGDKDRQIQAEKEAVERSVNELRLANREIENYIRKGGPAQLDEATAAIEELEKAIHDGEEGMNKIAKQVKTFEDDLRNVEETKRQIADNQDYRRDLNSLQDLATEIEDLESHNAEDEKKEYEEEGSRWEMERNRLTADQASLMGQLKSKDDQLQQLLQDWETEYKGAADKYKEAHIKVETTKAAVEDLARYGGALDKAIMKYHSLKMEEINRIIEELWRKTYQGTDVDSVLIRSDNENVKGNKSYNYRVVMVKQDAEMDMRGRCSAGQKVLASIIIRLALAECFGTNCGLIALDEPTTNLDRDNIKALAESLAEIIRVRRQQRNFQLIVITHDEEFLRYMQCADFADHYYRVSRNERQKSIIIRQNIAEVCL